MSEKIPTGVPTPEERMEATPETKRAFLELADQLSKGGDETDSKAKRYRTSEFPTADGLITVRGNVDYSGVYGVAKDEQWLLNMTIVARVVIEAAKGKLVQQDVYELFRDGALRHEVEMYAAEDMEKSIDEWQEGLDREDIVRAAADATLSSEELKKSEAEQIKAGQELAEEEERLGITKMTEAELRAVNDILKRLASESRG